MLKIRMLLSNQQLMTKMLINNLSYNLTHQKKHPMNLKKLIHHNLMIKMIKMSKTMLNHNQMMINLKKEKLSQLNLYQL